MHMLNKAVPWAAGYHNYGYLADSFRPDSTTLTHPVEICASLISLAAFTGVKNINQHSQDLRLKKAEDQTLALQKIGDILCTYLLILHSDQTFKLLFTKVKALTFSYYY